MILRLIVTVFLVLLCGFPLKSQDQFMEAFLQKWRHSAAYTLECAELMPEGNYDFSPTLEEMSFQKQLVHILQNMLWLSTDYLDLSPFHSDLRNADPSKSELLDLISKAFDHIEKELLTLPTHKLREKADFFAGEKTLFQILELMDDHITHHRGQLSVYLRLNNIKPPSYVGW